jgi:hypothetical protein
MSKTQEAADMRRLLTVALAVVACAAACSDGPSAPAPSAPPSASASPSAPARAGDLAPVADPYTPTINPAAFSSVVDNPFFPLRPGMTWQYRSQTADGLETTLVTVTSRQRVIMGVACVEVRDTVRLDGSIIEDTLDWYAQSGDGTVWYFGEDTKEYENGKVATTKGSWVAGVDGAQPGILMPGRPEAGDRYRQEFYRGDAEDLAEILSTDAVASVPTGSYTGVLETKETTPLEPSLLENKYYARGIGPVLTVDLNGGGVRDELVSFTS